MRTMADLALRLLGIGGAAALVACSPAAEVGEATNTISVYQHPVSGLEVVPVTVTTDSASHVFKAEVARTPQQQSRGLMGREELGRDEAMIFPYNPPKIASFWMKDTPRSLDIIFVGPDGRIINIGERTEPFSTESVMSDEPASLILEINGGLSRELGIGPGDLVEW